VLHISEATLSVNILIIEALGNEVVELIKDELQVGVHDTTRTLSTGEVGMISDSVGILDKQRAAKEWMDR